MSPDVGAGIDIFLHPGEWYFADRHTRIHTTLGSCVAVTLWNARLRVGGMCHYMLPGTGKKEASPNARYGDEALKLMMGEIRRLGSRPENYVAKLFGGASMFDVGPGSSTVAQRNIAAAEQLMQRYQLEVVSRSLGGSVYRQIVFNINNGDVWVRRGECRPEYPMSSCSGGTA